MEELKNITAEESRILNQLEEIFSHIRLAGQVKPSGIELGINTIKSLRHLIYEDMNQIQHEVLILKTVEILANKFPRQITKWFWNPRQTGTIDEPDLRGIDKQGETIISAEVTTSEKPQGLIDKRMAKTLEKLSTMHGNKYYVVTTPEMEQRAKTKMHKKGYQIIVLSLE